VNRNVMNVGRGPGATWGRVFLLAAAASIFSEMYSAKYPAVTAGQGSGFITKKCCTSSRNLRTSAAGNSGVTLWAQ
jgi:hypothetical protein